MSANFLTPKNWDNATDIGRNNLVFQNRNHAYGAYAIRRDYNHHLFLALFISTGIFISAFIVPKLLFNNYSAPLVAVPQTDQIETTICIIPPPEKLTIETPPPVLEKTVKPVATQNNVAPVVTDVKVDNTIVPNEKIINPGTTTTPGDVGLPVVTKPNVDDGIGKEITPPTIAVYAEVMPHFQGGEEALFRYLKNNINYPRGASENGIKGTVIVGFVIDVTGKPVMLSILKGIRGGKDLEAEAMRVVAAMPNWTVGMQNDKPVPVQFSLPVRFDLK